MKKLLSFYHKSLINMQWIQKVKLMLWKWNCDNKIKFFQKDCHWLAGGGIQREFKATTKQKWICLVKGTIFLCILHFPYISVVISFVCYIYFFCLFLLYGCIWLSVFCRLYTICPLLNMTCIYHLEHVPFHNLCFRVLINYLALGLATIHNVNYF